MMTATMTPTAPTFARIDPGHPFTPNFTHFSVTTTVTKARRDERLAMAGVGTPAGRVALLIKARDGFRAAGLVVDAERVAGLIA